MTLSPDLADPVPAAAEPPGQDTGNLQVNLKPFVGIKEAARSMPNFQPLDLSGTTFDMNP